MNLDCCLFFCMHCDNYFTAYLHNEIYKPDKQHLQYIMHLKFMASFHYIRMFVDQLPADFNKR